MLAKYFIFTVIVAIFSYFCVNFSELPSILRLDIISALAPSVVSYISSVENIFIDEEPEPKSRLYSLDELKQFNGEHKKEIYLSILGNVFDVTKGNQHYAPGGAYHGFAGRDATRAFVSGDFTEEGLTDDISDFDFDQLIGVQGWVKMYENKYEYKGKLVGKYYDDLGEPTSYLKEIETKIALAEEHKKDERKDKEKYPPCNVEWTQSEGSRVWCSLKSGGIERSWVGVPRKYYPAQAKSFRCACINEEELGKLSTEIKIEEYKNCHAKATTCFANEA